MARPRLSERLSRGDEAATAGAPARSGIELGRNGYSQAERPVGAVWEEATVAIIWLLIVGLIIGLLGKFVAPGSRDNTPIWLTLLCGIGGVLLGYYVSGALGVAQTNGVDWIRWIISIAIAAVLVMLASSLTGRSHRRSVV
jgi:uncharacterized membrane protein YeaQ/YmgE (transglycosylase-associated protein family)